MYILLQIVVKVLTYDKLSYIILLTTNCRLVSIKYITEEFQWQKQ